jgi:putative endonuclease
MAFYVYMLASKRNGTLYIGMTDDLLKRVWLHREGILPGLTRDYGVKHLVWYETHES